MIIRDTFTEVSDPCIKFDPSLPTTAEVKNEWHHIFTLPYIFVPIIEKNSPQ
jgi:hypothetical protein